MTNERRGIEPVRRCPRRRPSRRRPGTTFALNWESSDQRRQLPQRQAHRLRRRATTTCRTTATNTPGRNDYWNTEDRVAEPGHPASSTTARSDLRRLVEPLRGRPVRRERLPHLQVRRASTRRPSRPTCGAATAASPTTTTPSACAGGLEEYFSRPDLRRTDDAFSSSATASTTRTPKYSGYALYAQDSMRARPLDRQRRPALRRLQRRLAGGPRRLRRLRRSTSSTRASASSGTSSATPAPRSRRTGAATTTRCTPTSTTARLSGEAVIPDQDCYWDADTGRYDRLRRADLHRGATWARSDHPYVDETLLTFEQQLGPDMVIGVDYIDRRFRNIMAMINVNNDSRAYAATDNPLGGGNLPICNLNSAAGVRADHRQRRLPRLPVGDAALREALLPRLVAAQLVGLDRPRRATSSRTTATPPSTGTGTASPTPTARWTTPTASGSSSSPAPSTCRSASRSAASTPTSPAGTGRRTCGSRGLDYNVEHGPLHLPDRARLAAARPTATWSTCGWRGGPKLGKAMRPDALARGASTLLNSDTVRRRLRPLGRPTTWATRTPGPSAAAYGDTDQIESPAADPRRRPRSTF